MTEITRISHQITRRYMSKHPYHLLLLIKKKRKSYFISDELIEIIKNTSMDALLFEHINQAYTRHNLRLHLRLNLYYQPIDSNVQLHEQ